MSAKYKCHAPNDLYFCTLTVVRWIDLFTRKRFRDLLLENLAFCQKTKGLHICGYVVMSNHVHLLAWTESPYELSKVLGNFKSFTANQILHALRTEPESRRDWLLYLFKNHAAQHKKGQEHQIWVPDNHPIHVFSPKVAMQKLEYIHLNPVKAGWVRHAEDWLYSSASNYVYGEGLLEVDLLSPVLYGE